MNYKDFIGHKICAKNKNDIIYEITNWCHWEGIIYFNCKSISNSIKFLCAINQIDYFSRSDEYQFVLMKKTKFDI